MENTNIILASVDLENKNKAKVIFGKTCLISVRFNTVFEKRTYCRYNLYLYSIHKYNYIYVNLAHHHLAKGRTYKDIFLKSEYILLSKISVLKNGLCIWNIPQIFTNKTKYSPSCRRPKFLRLPNLTLHFTPYMQIKENYWEVIDIFTIVN